MGQGSILRPDHWSTSYDSLLQLEVPNESYLVEYIEDAQKVEQAEFILEMVMPRVSRCITEHEISLGMEKTEVVFLTKECLFKLVKSWSCCSGRCNTSALSS